MAASNRFALWTESIPNTASITENRDGKSDQNRRRMARTPRSDGIRGYPARRDRASFHRTLLGSSRTWHLHLRLLRNTFVRIRCQVRIRLWLAELFPPARSGQGQRKNRSLVRHGPY